MIEKGDDIVVLQYFDSAIEANIAKTKLDANEVPCFLTEENMAGLYPGQSLSVFKIRLHLFASDRDRALQVLWADRPFIHSDAGPACPLCHSTKITREFPRKSGETLVYLIFGVLMPHKKVNLCLQCGCEF